MAPAGRLGRVDVQLLYFDDCPGWRDAEAHLEQALWQCRALDAVVTRVEVRSQEDAERLRFRGSPTLTVDGQDLFPDHRAVFGLACRVYLTAHGPASAPTVEQLAVALHHRSA